MCCRAEGVRAWAHGASRSESSSNVSSSVAASSRSSTLTCDMSITASAVGATPSLNHDRVIRTMVDAPAGAESETESSVQGHSHGSG